MVSGLVCLTSSGFSSGLLFSVGGFVLPLTFWHRNYFFLILAHPVYKI